MTAFAEQGYEGTSLATVADSIGLSQPGLLHHFPSKRALLLAVLQQRDDVDGERVGLSSQQSGLAALDGLVELMAYNAAQRGIVQSFSVLTGESAAEQHPGHEHFTRRYERIRAELAGALDRGVATGEIRADVDCRAIAVEVFAMMDGLQLQWLHDPATVDMVSTFRSYVDRLKHDLATAAAG